MLKSTQVKTKREEREMVEGGEVLNVETDGVIEQHCVLGHHAYVAP
jgi:hypothetical protein